MVVEDVPADDSPLCPAPAPVVRVRCRKAAPRCSRCGRKCPEYDDGGGERRRPIDQAGAGLERWIFRASHSRIPEIVEPCGKTRGREDDILGAIGLGHSNAGPEAFNDKIKITIHMAYVFRHADNLIAMIKLRCSSLPIHLPTPIL